VTADDAGPIGLYKFTFGISTTTVVIINDTALDKDTTGFYLYESDAENTLGDIISQGSTENSGDIVGGGDMVGATTTDAGDEYLLETYLDVNNDAEAGRDQRIISAGDTKYYTLRGTVSNHDGTGSISTFMTGDAAFAHTALLSADGVDGKDNDDFIWTDLNADQYSTSTATHTIMYVSGYRVSGLESTSSTPQTIFSD